MPKLKEIKEHFNKDVNPNLIRFFSKKTAPYLAKLILYTSITGNQVSFFMGILAVIASILLSFGEFWYVLIGVLLLYFQRNLDDVDGLIARYHGKASIRGIYVDLVVSSMTGPLAYLGLSIGIFKVTGNLWFLTFGMLAAIFSYMGESVQHLKNQGLVMKLIQYSKGEKLQDLEGKIFTKTKTESKQKTWKTYAAKIFEWLTFYYSLFLLLPAVIFNVTHWYLIFYGIALPLKWLILALYEFKTGYKHLEYLFKPYQIKK